ncbi:unnamed protein product [Prorocentrum cordatum]|uniref:Transmembrane protein 138 n=1 Tax=Prorocentrum cordatum TaxID=2364126 RepID=A0ABN9W3A1_9DINO|nr:unnamed protein product [Polarella glacialis]
MLWVSSGWRFSWLFWWEVRLAMTTTEMMIVVVIAVAACDATLFLQGVRFVHGPRRATRGRQGRCARRLGLDLRVLTCLSVYLGMLTFLLIVRLLWAESFLIMMLVLRRGPMTGLVVPILLSYLLAVLSSLMVRGLLFLCLLDGVVVQYLRLVLGSIFTVLYFALLFVLAALLNEMLYPGHFIDLAASIRTF